MRRYKLSGNARDDLQRIYEFGVVTFGEARAESYIHGFFRQFEQISQNPESYQAVDYIRKGYRRCNYQSDSIYYRTGHTGVVEIMAILGGQDVDNWL